MLVSDGAHALSVDHALHDSTDLNRLVTDGTLLHRCIVHLLDIM
jgi:hypothetical protein